MSSRPFRAASLRPLRVAALLPLPGLLLLAGCGAAPTPAADAAGVGPATAESAEEEEVAVPAPGEAPGDMDFVWLEEVEGEDALAWVREQNERSLARIEAWPDFEEFEANALEVLTSRDSIPWPSLRGDQVWNFWRDAEHERGIWRFTSVEDYRNAEPDWDIVIDVDRLAEEEEENWVWGGAACRYPDYDRCLVRLSIGGADASVRREFDLASRTFVEDGFVLPESKSAVSWRDRDSVFYGPAFEESQMTSSGYPRQVFLWERGTAPEDATLIFEGEREDVSVRGSRSWDLDTPWDFVVRARTFFTRDYFLWHEGELHPVDVPEDALLVGVVQGWLMIELKSDWEREGETWPQGALLAQPIEAVWGEAGDTQGDTQLVFAPGPQQSLGQIAATRGTVLISILDNVQGRFLRYTLEEGRWEGEALDVPSLGSLRLVSTDDRSERFYYSYSGFLTPTTLFEADARTDERVEVRREPSWFDASGMTVEQHMATSADGTQVPYFLVLPAGFEAQGNAPTLISAYGGFEISRTPFYGAVTGRNWLSRGGVFVVANIRGGGEFGPAWHQAALRHNRQRAFDDLIAVAEDLVARDITAPAHMGVQGGSNGGLLTGAMMVQRPELFGAVISAVPLLDMVRYHTLLAGASWVAEYGDPEVPEDLAVLRSYSPFHNLDPEASYPVPFLWTSTRDDRVHPGHARRFVARMLEQGHDVLYWENIEGGHGGAANQRQQAYISALTWSYLHERLGGERQP